MKMPRIINEAMEYILGFFAIVAFYVWQYDSLSPGWRFFGMVIISLVVGVAIQLLIMKFDWWRSARVEKKRSSAMCRAVGVDEESTDPEEVSKCWRYMIARYSSDLLANRLSDLIGLISTSLSVIISIGISLWFFGMIAYFVWFGDYGEPSLLWFPMLFRVIVLLCECFIGFTCNVLFNRYPGEARRFNKNYDKLRKTDALLASKEFRDSIQG